MCEILGFKNVNEALLKQVKQAYELDQKSLEFVDEISTNPVSYHAGKAVYISGPDLYQHQIKRMTGCIKEPHTTLFTGPTGCGKTNLVLDLIEKEYKKHFE